MADFNLKVFKEVSKRFGDTLLTGIDDIPVREVMPLKDPIIDKLLAGDSEVGGLMINAIIEISGSYSSGKTTLALEYLAEFASENPKQGIAFIDVEHALDLAYARHIGVPVDEERFAYARPKTGVDALTMARNLMLTEMYSCIVIDSWAALAPPREADVNKDIGSYMIGEHAKLSSSALKVFSNLVDLTETTFIILNQERVNLTAMGARGKKTTGGYAMDFYPHMRISINKSGGKKSSERLIEITKSKCQALPWTSAKVHIVHNVGLDRQASLINIAIEQKVITGGGAWYTIPLPDGEDKKLNGAAKMAKYLAENDDARNHICDLLGMDHFKARLPMIRRIIGDVVLDDDSETEMEQDSTPSEQPEEEVKE